MRAGLVLAIRVDIDTVVIYRTIMLHKARQRPRQPETDILRLIDVDFVCVCLVAQRNQPLAAILNWQSTRYKRNELR